MSREELEIKNIIREEVVKHRKNLDNHHIDTIVNALYKQLTEYLSVEDLSKMIYSLRYEFINIVDTLIPLVEEYETKIEHELDNYIGKLINTPV